MVKRNAFAIGLLMVAAVCTRSHAQNSPETSTASLQALAQSTYRHLLVPIGELDVRPELEISAEQFSIFQEHFDKHRPSFPPFSILVKTEDGVSKFLEIGAKRMREADTLFQAFFEEVLLPIQSDKLLGMHLIEHGMIGYAHPAFKARLELSEDQVVQIRTLIAEDLNRGSI